MSEAPRTTEIGRRRELSTRRVRPRVTQDSFSHASPQKGLQQREGRIFDREHDGSGGKGNKEAPGRKMRSAQLAG